MNPEEKVYLRNLSTLKPWKSVYLIAFEWLLIIGLFFIRNKFPNPVFLLIMIPLMATRMYALYSLLHDGIHGLLSPKKRINDMVSRFFLAWPIFISFDQMKRNHLQHHRYLGAKNDPEQQLLIYEEFQFPMSLNKFIFIVLKDITGFNFIYYKWMKIKRLNMQVVKFSFGNYAEVFTYYALVLLILIFTKQLLAFLLLWILPYCTIFPLLNRLRAYTEHHNITDKQISTRTLKLSPILSFFFAPYNLGYHTEHHMYPSVPNYNLSALHEYLINKKGNLIYVSNSLYSTLSNIWQTDEKHLSKEDKPVGLKTSSKTDKLKVEL